VRGQKRRRYDDGSDCEEVGVVEQAASGVGRGRRIERVEGWSSCKGEVSDEPVFPRRLRRCSSGAAVSSRGARDGPEGKVGSHYHQGRDEQVIVDDDEEGEVEREVDRTSLGHKTSLAGRLFRGIGEKMAGLGEKVAGYFGLVPDGERLELDDEDSPGDGPVFAPSLLPFERDGAERPSLGLLEVDGEAGLGYGDSEMGGHCRDDEKGRHWEGPDDDDFKQVTPSVKPSLEAERWRSARCCMSAHAARRTPHRP